MKNSDLFNYTPSTAKDWSHLDKFFSILAQEQLLIVRKATRTASINLSTRTITIPNFAADDKDVFLLLGSHEVSHALHTPAEWCHEETGKIRNASLRRCINIVEDIRIERLMRRKFPGFASIYARGYIKLLGRDFFSIKKWAQFDLADRLNAYAKLGKSLPVEMTDYDMAVWKNISRLDSFEDTLKHAHYLFKLLKLEKEAKAKPEAPKPEPTQPEPTPPTDEDDGGEPESTEADDVEDSEESDETGDGEESGGESDDSQEAGESSDGESDDDGESAPADDSDENDDTSDGDSGDDADGEDGAGDINESDDLNDVKRPEDLNDIFEDDDDEPPSQLEDALDKAIDAQMGEVSNEISFKATDISYGRFSAPWIANRTTEKTDPFAALLIQK